MRAQDVIGDAPARQAPIVNFQGQNFQGHTEAPLPAALREMSQRMYRADTDVPVGGVPAKWLAFLSVACEAVALVKAGVLDRQQAGEALRDWSDRYFDCEFDEPSQFSVNQVLKAFARATRAIAVAS